MLQICLLYRAGELAVIEYGTNEVLAVCRTEHMSPFLLSVAAVEPRGTAPAAKRVAYLVDLQTIRVLDMLTGASTLATVSHDCRIDWLVRGWQRMDSMGRMLNSPDVGGMLRCCSSWLQLLALLAPQWRT
jgi:methylthioribose-1-phosphate isomerase